jgi:hypothetical protein
MKHIIKNKNNYSETKIYAFFTSGFSGLRPPKPVEGLARTSLFKKKKPSYAKASEGEGGPSWDRTSDPLIMSQVLLTI